MSLFESVLLGAQLSDSITMPSSRFFAFLLGGAALSLVLSTSASAEVLIDQQQLTGQGKTVAQQVYADVHQRPSPFGQMAMPTMLPNEPMVITSKGYGTKNSITTSAAKEPIALKPLPKWGMAAPAAPISTGERSAILLRPPSAARDVIHQLAQQSPVRSDAQQTADNSPLRLRPPAPIPPAPQFAQMQHTTAPAQYAIAPQPNTQVMAPMPQVAAMAPPPANTAIAAPVVPPQPQMQMAMNAAPVATAVPVSQMGQLRAEDVVALDFGSGESGKPVEQKKPEAQPVANIPPAAPVEKSKSDDVLPDVPTFMPPLEDEQPAPVKTSEASAVKETASAEPQFISPLIEGLPTDEDSSEDKTSTLAMMAPAAPATTRAKHEEPQTDAVKTADAPPAPKLDTPSFISAFDDAADTAPKVAETATDTIVAAAPKPEHVLPNIPAAPKAEPIAEPKLADAEKIEKAAEVGETHASADHAADAVVQSLKEPAASKENFAAATATPEQTQIATADIDWNADAKPKASKATKKAKAVKNNVTTVELSPEEKLQVALKEKAEADAKAQAEAQELIRKQEAEIARLKAETDAKAKAEADRLAQIQSEELARQQQEEIARIQAEADAKAKAEAERLAKAQAEEYARQQKEELARVKAEAEAKAKAEAEQLAKEQAEEAKKLADAQAEKIEKLAKAREEEIAQAKAEALEQAKADMEAEARAKAEAKIVADKKAADEAITERARQQLAAAREKLNADMPAVPTTPVERVNITEEPEKIKASGVETASLNSGAVSDAIASAEPAPLVQQTVLFKSGMSVLPSTANAVVKDLAQQAKNSRDAKIILSAYADGTSQASSSARRLSLQRAMLMRDALNKMGVAISRVEVRAQTAAPGDANPDRVDITLQ